MVAELSNKLRYEFGVAFLVDRMCGLSHDDLWVQARVLRLLEQPATNSRDAELVVVEAQNRVGGRPGAADGQVDTRVLVRTDKWYGSEKAWPIWSFVTRGLCWGHRSRFVVGHDECRDQNGREQRAAWRCAVVCRLDHVVHKKSSGLCCECNVQLGHGGMENVLSCVFLVERHETCCIDARSVGNFAGHERCGGQSGCSMHRNEKHRFECIGRVQDSEFVCWYCEKQQ